VAEKPDWALATFLLDGQPVAAIEQGGVAYRLEPSLARIGRPGFSEVIALFADWPASEAALDAAAARLDAADRLPPAPRLAPLLYPGKILCAGANYFDHLAEMGMPGARREDQRLFFFMKPPRNAIVGEGATVRMPLGTRAFDWEIELACVIGRRARNVTPEQALAHVAAWTIAIDFSARDHNRAPETFYKLDWVAGKANDTCCPIGPRIVPARVIPDPQDVALRLSVNGEIKQDGRSSDMIFRVAEQIATASRIMTLDPGDLLLTGTPAGVGAPKGTFLKVGDVVEVEIPPIGRFAVTIQEPA
jgi:2-keto-4-pentenoate hydratase/2-oxohepta-3-ene-1,7-dioic acid hydratase in catechol pathway